VFLCGLPRFLTGVALVRPCQLDRVARGLLRRRAEMLDLGTLLFVGRRDVYRQQMAGRVDSHVQLASSLRL